MLRDTWLQNLIEIFSVKLNRRGARLRGMRLRTTNHVLEALEIRRLLSAVPVTHAPAISNPHIVANVVGPEIQVSTQTRGDQVRPQVAMDAAGDYIVVWTDYSGADGSGKGIFAQRYNAAGVAQGSNFQVNAYTTGNQFRPSVAMDSAGDFVVTWSSYRQDGQGWGIFARRYNAAGVAAGREFQVNVSTSRDQVFSSVAMDSAGDFVVTWTGVTSAAATNGIFGRLYNAAGTARGSEFKVNSSIPGARDHSAVAMDSSGDFVVTWQSSSGDGDGYGIFARRFNAAGAPQGLDFAVNTYTKNNQLDPSIGIDAAGDFVIAWQTFLKDGSAYGIAARRFNAAGVAAGPEFNVNSITTGSQFSPAVAMNAAGDFAIAWTSFNTNNNLDDVYLRRYGSTGVAKGIEVRVNTFTTSVQAAPAIAMDALGDTIVAWDSAGQAGSSYGVFAKKYGPA